MRREGVDALRALPPCFAPSEPWRSAPAKPGHEDVGWAGLACCRWKSERVRFWIASFALRALAMTMERLADKSIKVFCAAFFQKSGYLLT